MALIEIAFTAKLLFDPDVLMTGRVKNEDDEAKEAVEYSKEAVDKDKKDIGEAQYVETGEFKRPGVRVVKLSIIHWAAF